MTTILWVWAIGATAAAFYYKADRNFLRRICERKDDE